MNGIYLHFVNKHPLPDGLYWDFNPFPKQTLVFTYLRYKTFENTLERKRRISPFPSVFYPGEISVMFIKFNIICPRTLSVWKSLKTAVWEKG